MIGWEHTASRDYAEAAVNGQVDEDLESMIGTLELRIKERDGVKRCPYCEDLLEDVHVHDGFRVIPDAVATLPLGQSKPEGAAFAPSDRTSLQPVSDR